MRSRRDQSSQTFLGIQEDVKKRLEMNNCEIGIGNIQQAKKEIQGER